MALVVGIDITKILGQDLEGYFHGAAGIGNILGAEDDQVAVARSPLGIARHFHGQDFRVGRLDGFIRRHDLGAGPGATADNADGAVFFRDAHERVDNGIQVGNDNALSLPQTHPHELGYLHQAGTHSRRPGIASRRFFGVRLPGGSGTHPFHHLLHDLVDQFLLHRTSPPESEQLRIGSPSPAIR